MTMLRTLCVLVACAPLIAGARGPDTDRRLQWLTPGSVPLPEGLTETPAAPDVPRLDISVPEDVGLWGETRFRIARVELLGDTVLEEAAVEALLG